MPVLLPHPPEQRIAFGTSRAIIDNHLAVGRQQLGFQIRVLIEFEIQALPHQTQIGFRCAVFQQIPVGLGGHLHARQSPVPF